MRPAGARVGQDQGPEGRHAGHLDFTKAAELDHDFVTPGHHADTAAKTFTIGAIARVAFEECARVAQTDCADSAVRVEGGVGLMDGASVAVAADDG